MPSANEVIGSSGKMKIGIFDNIPELLDNSVKVGSAVQNGYLVNEFLVLYTLLRGFVGDKNDIQKAIREKKQPLKYHGTAQATMVELMKSLEITGEAMVDHFFHFLTLGKLFTLRSIVRKRLLSLLSGRAMLVRYRRQR